MATYTWSHERIIEVIDMYEDRPSLYNIKHPEYFNRDKRSNALSEIAAAMEFPAKEIEKKLRNIRTQYTREKQKTKKTKSGAGADDIYESKWPHFKRLQFLDEFVTAKNSRSNLQAIEAEQQDQAGSSPIEIEGMENEDAVQILDSECSDPGVKSTKRPISTREQRPKCTNRPNKIMQEDELLKKAIVVMENTGNVIQRKRDNEDIFGEYIASELRSIHNVEMRRYLKFKMQSLLFSAHSGLTPHSPQPSQAYPLSQPFSPQATPSQWDYPDTTPPAGRWNTQPFRTPSTDSSLNDECINI